MSAQLAPNFTLTHLAGHSVSLSDYHGRPVIIVIGGEDSAHQPKQIGQTIRSRFNAAQLPIISILDLRGVPRLVQGLVKRQIDKEYQNMVRDETASLQAAGQPVPADPARVAVMLTDWEGKVATSFGLGDINQQAVAVAVDGDGNIRGYGTGAQGGQQILALFG